jgi:hypothetical protein
MARTIAAAWKTMAAPKSMARSFERLRNNITAKSAAASPVSHIAAIDGAGYATHAASSLRKRASQEIAIPPSAAKRIVANVVSTPNVIARGSVFLAANRNSTKLTIAIQTVTFAGHQSRKNPRTSK